MEYQDNVDDEDDEDSEEDEDSEDETEDSDDEGLGYTVATKEDYVPVQVKEKKKTKGGKQGEAESKEGEEKPQEAAEDAWSQQQQKTLELALMQYPKGTSERWDRIAGKVPGKSKEQCMLRFKSLAEMVKKKRQEAAAS